MSESKLQLAMSGLKKKQFLACPRPLFCSGVLPTIKLKLTATAATFACARGLTGKAHFSLSKPACLQGCDTVVTAARSNQNAVASANVCWMVCD